MRLPPLPSVRDLIKLYKLRAIKQLSQNFLLQERVTDKIVKAAGKLNGFEVCEVGPGPGSITRSILKKNPANLVLVEKDPRFLPTLEMLAEASSCPVRIITDDILNLNMENLFSQNLSQPWTGQSPSIHLIGNLPFNISTPLIIRWIQAISERTSAWRYGRVRLTLTFQKEVAERMAAPVMTTQRCRLSVMCQNYCTVDHKFNIPGSAFVPPPKVDVGVVTLEPVVQPIIDLPFPIVEKVTRAVFLHRQKYITRGICTLFPKRLRDDFTAKVIEASCLSPQLRPFMLTVTDMGRICHAYWDLVSNDPQLAQYEYRTSKEIVGYSVEDFLVDSEDTAPEQPSSTSPVIAAA